MCLGRTHALSGLVTGAAVGEFVTHADVPHLIALSGFTAGMALLLDLDTCGSSGSRSLGFLSESLAWLIGRLSGGHRHFTHSAAGIAAFTGLAWLACHFRADIGGKIGLALLVTIATSSALEALHLTDGHIADIIGLAVAGAVVWYGYGLALIPLAVLVGCITHAVGDSLTDSGVMWLYPLSQYRVRPPEPIAFTTGSRPELWLVDPALTVLLGLLAWHAAAVSLPGISL